MRLLIVTGTSGSGKSSALNTLEDLGFYCVDNLPIALVNTLVDRLSDSIRLSHQGIAICIDIRTEDEGIEDFRDHLNELAKTIDVTVMFFDANEPSLNQRFNETRRRHPLSQGGRSLSDAIKLERVLLEPLAAAADLFVDTSEMTPYEQRQFIQERVTASQASTMSILVKSFGFKKGAPVDADIMFDMRMLPNPHWEASLRPRTGQDESVKAFLECHAITMDVRSDIVSSLTRWIPQYQASQRAYLTVAIGCTGGKHRSVYMAEAIASDLRHQFPQVALQHRDMPTS
jgi:UPF0042 nucleotide-binding protein